MATEYKLHSFAIDEEFEYGRRSGPDHIVALMQVGKRVKLERIEITEAKALEFAEDLLRNVRMMRVRTERRDKREVLR